MGGLGGCDHLDRHADVGEVVGPSGDARCLAYAAVGCGVGRHVPELVEGDAAHERQGIREPFAERHRPPARDLGVDARWWSVASANGSGMRAADRGRHRLPALGGSQAYPASHGCVRQAASVAAWTYDFAYVGPVVKVISNLLTRPLGRLPLVEGKQTAHHFFPRHGVGLRSS